MTNSNRHTCNSSTWRTPKEFLEASRETLGNIDLDPASCKAYNFLVKADKFFGAFSPIAENGYLQDWDGNVFINPPGGRCDIIGRSVLKKKGVPGFLYENGEKCVGKAYPSVKHWWNKLIKEWLEDRTKAAIFLAFSMELCQTAQAKPTSNMVPTDFPLCFPKRRISFLDDYGQPVSGNTHASVVIFLPPKNPKTLDDLDSLKRFMQFFSSLGKVCNLNGDWTVKLRDNYKVSTLRC